MEQIVPARPRVARQQHVEEVPVSLDFDAFFRVEYPRMVSLAHSICGDLAVAEELAQEAFTRAHRRWDQVSRYDRPGAWLRRVLINLAVSSRRRFVHELRIRTRLARERPPSTEIALPDPEVWDAVRTLPPRQRAVVALFYTEDMSTAAIADVLDCSVSTATSHLSAARARLATILGEES